MTKSELIRRLRHTLTRFYAQYHLAEERKIFAKFDRTLFSEDFQSFGFYVRELEHTLASLEKLQGNDATQYRFYSHKLLAQCNALADALVPAARQPATTVKTGASARERQKQLIHQLPPRERLEKYYAALQALNEKLEKQHAGYMRSTDHSAKQYYLRQTEITKQRRLRCLEAIELLEEYLALKQD